MNILYYFWGENSEHDIEQTFLGMGHQVLKFSYSFNDYEKDDAFLSQIEAVFKSHAIDFVFSFNFFPILSTACQINQIRYVSWIYDCPHFSLFSKTVYHDVNRIFLFDKEQFYGLQKRGVAHIYHLPLAGNSSRLLSYLPIQFPCQSYMHDVTFIGSFYEQNMFSSISYLPDYFKGYLDALLKSQGKIWGGDLITPLLNDDLLSQLKPYISYESMDGYEITFRDFCSFLLLQKLTFIERKQYLNRISQHEKLDIYSASDVNALCPAATAHPFISYFETMPRIFYQSKINLNFTLRSITSGIPLRCMDILASGGFLLSNYQKELAECFTPDKDFVFFEDENDLLDKISFYLKHDTLRNEIAEHGFHTLNENYSYEIQVKKMLSYL